MHADSMQDSKVILLPAWNSTEAEKVYAFYVVCHLIFTQNPKHYLTIINFVLNCYLIYISAIIDTKSFRKSDAAKFA